MTVRDTVRQDAARIAKKLDEDHDAPCATAAAWLSEFVADEALHRELVYAVVGAVGGYARAIVDLGPDSARPAVQLVGYPGRDYEDFDGSTIRPIDREEDWSEVRAEVFAIRPKAVLSTALVRTRKTDDAPLQIDAVIADAFGDREWNLMTHVMLPDATEAFLIWPFAPDKPAIGGLGHPNGMSTVGPWDLRATDADYRDALLVMLEAARSAVLDLNLDLSVPGVVRGYQEWYLVGDSDRVCEIHRRHGVPVPENPNEAPVAVAKVSVNDREEVGIGVLAGYTHLYVISGAQVIKNRSADVLVASALADDPGVPAISGNAYRIGCGWGPDVATPERIGAVLFDGGRAEILNQSEGGKAAWAKLVVAQAATRGDA